MRIPAPNYTQTPNVCFDELFKTLKEGELRVILVIIRQTFGWHRSFDRISLSQIADKSGIDRRSVCRALASLISKKLVAKKKFGEKGKERCYYTLVLESIPEETVDPLDGIESEEEMELISNNFSSDPRVTTLVTPGSLPQGPTSHYPSDIRSPTKETIKETIQKKKVVCSEAPPAAPPLENKNISDEISKIDLTHPDGTKYKASMSEVFSWAIKTNKNFTTQEIQEAWDILKKSNQLIRNPFHFIEGTIKNIRQSKTYQKITNKEQNKCQTNNYDAQMTKYGPMRARTHNLGDVMRGLA